jgi:hypothetical protein
MSIGYAAFYDCESLTSVSLSRQTELGDEVFPASAQIKFRD